MLTAVHMHPVPAVTATESDPPALTTDSLVGLALNVQAPLLTSLKNQLNPVLKNTPVVAGGTHVVVTRTCVLVGGLMNTPHDMDTAKLVSLLSKFSTMFALVVWPAKLTLSV